MSTSTGWATLTRTIVLERAPARDTRGRVCVYPTQEMSLAASSARMEDTNLLTRLLSGTRRSIVLLLRSQPRTVRELSDALDLTRNAIRSQLSNLERDGLVDIVDHRPTERKPEHVYDLTDEGEKLFPKSYDAVVNTLVSVLADEYNDEDLDRILTEVGRRIAWLYKPHRLGASPVDRVQRARDVLRELGGLPSVVEDGDRYRIEGVSCPLAAVVEAHGERACDLARALLEELTELPVQRCCRVDSDTQECCFVVDASSTQPRSNGT